MKSNTQIIKEKVDLVINYFHTQNEAAAFSVLVELVDMLMEYYNILDNKDEDVRILKELLSAIENRDTVLISDILEYEFKNRFQ